MIADSKTQVRHEMLPPDEAVSRLVNTKEADMVSSRAEEVAEILWELKRADKLATYTNVARRAGFSAGSNGRAVLTTLRAVRQGWPHLQWWRAINDSGQLEKGSEHEAKLVESGYGVEAVEGNDETVALEEVQEHLMTWEEAAEESDGTAE
jgi:alkylated DNA nucleotide flippase Atl1